MDKQTERKIITRLDKIAALHAEIRALLGDQEPAKAAPKPKRKSPVWARIDGLNVDAWMRWLQSRKERGLNPYRSEAPARWLVRETGGNHEQQAAIVQQSIDREWNGLFELKGKKPGPAIKREERFL